MGYHYPINVSSRRDLITELIKDGGWKRDDGKRVVQKVLAHCCRGNCLWTVREVSLDGKIMDTFVHLDLMVVHGGEWGYKPMSEECGPSYYTCPKSYIEKAGPTTSPNAIEWRKQVLAN